MKAIIMAGGMGTRLRCISGDRPKPMVPLLGKPMMEHIIERLRECGFTEICAALGYRAGDIMAYFGDGSRFGVELCYRTETKPLGTAGAVKNCRDFYGSEDFLVISGDCVCDFELEKLAQCRREKNSAAAIALYRSEEPLRYGLAVSDSEGSIRAFIEKPDWKRVVTDMINTGIYALSPEAMELVPDGRAYDFGHELFPELLRRGMTLSGLPMDGYWCDVGTPLSYYRCCEDALCGRVKLTVPEEYRISQSAEEPEREAEGYITLCDCRSRAGLMGTLSEMFMDMGADYSDGIRLDGKGYTLCISPCAARSAVSIGVSCADTEFAKSLALSARAVIEALEKQ